MLSKVRKSDLSFPPPPPPPPSPKTAQPAPVAAAPVQAPLPAEALPPVEAAVVAASAGAAPPVEEERYDILSILKEIEADEELLMRILGMLYRAKKKNPNAGAISIIDMEKQLGLARESGAFVINYMKARKLIETNDKSANMITVEGIEYLRNKLDK